MITIIQPRKSRIYDSVQETVIVEVKTVKHRLNQHGKQRNTESTFCHVPEHGSCHGRFIAQEAGIRRELDHFEIPLRSKER